MGEILEALSRKWIFIYSDYTVSGRKWRLFYQSPETGAKLETNWSQTHGFSPCLPEILLLSRVAMLHKSGWIALPGVVNVAGLELCLEPSEDSARLLIIWSSLPCSISQIPWHKSGWNALLFFALWLPTSKPKKEIGRLDRRTVTCEPASLLVAVVLWLKVTSLTSRPLRVLAISAYCGVTSSGHCIIHCCLHLYKCFLLKTFNLTQFRGAIISFLF